MNRFSVSFILAALIILALLLANRAEAAAKDVDDRNITNAVDVELIMDEVVNSNSVDISTRNGIVSLSGSADTVLARNRAERIAESVVGVRSVINRIKVDPVVRKDGKIKTDVMNAFLYDPAADSYEVTVSVNNGIVTLTGTVESLQEKALSGTIAKGVRGVREVKNDIVVVYPSERPDSEIRPEIIKALKNDILVDDNLIEVNVDDGNVMLSGTVGSMAEKRRAEIDAWVQGVNSVDSDELEVEWWARDKMRRKSMYADMNDKNIKQAVEDALKYDPRISPFVPEVMVENGTVTLSGVVDNLKAKRAAAQDAKNTIGVWRVKNHLKVRPKNIPSDAVLKKRVKDAFRRDPYIERAGVDVTVYNGTVFLNGTAQTSFEKSHASMVAAGVKGVVFVHNNIDFEQAWIWKPDWEIIEDVRDQLFWSPFVDEDRVRVKVRNGAVTLTGDVETWGERQAAEENAYEAGAKVVKNKLEVLHRLWGPKYFYQGAYYRAPYNYPPPVPPYL